MYISRIDNRGASQQRVQAMHRHLGIILLFSMLLQTACLAPKYARPVVVAPPAYKGVPDASDAQTSNWKLARPADAVARGKWWELFEDSQLDALEEQAISSNQNITAATANFAAARSLVRQARAAFFPTASVSPSVMRTRVSPTQLAELQATSSSSVAIKPYTDYSLPFDASWEPDFWGRIRNNVRANLYAAQASAGDLENVRLSEQAELAVDYFELRSQDSLKQVLDGTVTAYRESLELAQAQYHAGLGSDETLAQDEAQLRAAQAQDIEVGVLRAQYENAIAVLIGQVASSFSLPSCPLEGTPPEVPSGVPSELLERRPDIAAAERLWKAYWLYGT